jgi:hypothetical protein
MLITITNKNIDIIDVFTDIKLAKNLSKENIDKFLSKNLDSLVRLVAVGVRSLTKIPTINNLQHLTCDNSSNLTTIMTQPKLLFLYCSGCKKLKNLPYLPNLADITYNNTPINRWTVPIKQHIWLDNVYILDKILEYNPNEINSILSVRLSNEKIIDYLCKNQHYFQFMSDNTYEYVDLLFEKHGHEIPRPPLVKSA